MSPIPDAVAGPVEPPADPINKLQAEIQDIANMALRGEIDADTWETAIKEATGENKHEQRQ